MAPTRIKWIRTLLLALFLASASGIVYLLGFGGKEETAADPAVVEGDSDEEADKANFQVRSKNYRQVALQDDRVLFEVAAEEYSVDQEGKAALTKVTINAERDEGRYVIKGDSGNYDAERREAFLNSNVVAVGPQPFKLWTDWLRLENQGQLITVADDSRFQLGRSVQGQSKVLRIDLENQALLMNRGVKMGSLPGTEDPFSLEAQLLRFVGSKRLLRAEGGARLQRGNSSLAALRLSVYLDEYEDKVRFVRALWNVHGSLETGQPLLSRKPAATDASSMGIDGPVSTENPGMVDYRAMSLALEIDDRGRTTAADLRGTRRQPVTLKTRPREGVSRTIRAGQLFASFDDGSLSVVEGVNRVAIEESGPVNTASLAESNGPDSTGLKTDSTLTRMARGESASVSFDQAGEVVRVDLEGRVLLKEPAAVANADRASMQLLQGVTELFGEPLVQITTVDGLLTAPRAKFQHELGILSTSEGTRARLDRSQTLGIKTALGGSPEAELPVYVEALESLFREVDGTFSFKGDVRAWQGKNLLLCEQLRGGSKDNDLSASGGVRTIWYPPQTPESTQPTGGVAAEEPVEVRSEFMEYLGTEGHLVYEENVQLRQAAGLMRCSTLEMKLTRQNEVESMLCMGGKERASLVDETIGRSITGELMTYYPDQDRLVVEGKVEAVEGGRKFSGGTATYDLANGSFSAGHGRVGAVEDTMDAKIATPENIPPAPKTAPFFFH